MNSTVFSTVMDMSKETLDMSTQILRMAEQIDLINRRRVDLEKDIVEINAKHARFVEEFPIIPVEIKSEMERDLRQLRHRIENLSMLTDCLYVSNDTFLERKVQVRELLCELEFGF